MNILGSGNVGIGTTSPSSLFSLSNTSLVGDILPFAGANNVYGALGVHSLGNGGVYLDSRYANQDLRLRTQSIDRFTINSSGNVGIGTTNPYSLLANVDTSITDASGNGEASRGITWQTNTSGYAAAFNNIFNDATAMGVLVKTAWGGSASRAFTINSAGADNLVVLGNGNVGVGTTSPIFKLDVSGTGRFTQPLYLGNQRYSLADVLNIEGADPAISFATAANTIKLKYITSVGEQRLSMINGGGTETVSFLNNGNVGIGTTTPGTKLTIAGGGLSVEGDATGGFSWLSNGVHLSFNTTSNVAHLRALQNGVAWRELQIDGSPLVLNTTSGGNVGIGTTTPNGSLSIVGAASSLGTLSVYGSSGVGTNPIFAAYGDPLQATPRFTITRDGNVGIGTTNPSLKLDVQGNIGVRAGNTLRLFRTDNGNYATLDFTNNKFQINTGGTFVMDTSGNVGIGTTGFSAAGGRLMVSFDSFSQEGISMQTTANSTNGVFIRFANNSAAYIGGVSLNADFSSVTYNTTSDRRVKENIATTTLGLDTLLRLPVRDFDFINDPKHATTTGFIAQELREVFPSAVTTNGDNGVVPLGATSSPWGVDYGRITPLIVKAVQDIANLADTFKHTLIAWLGDANNGIGKLFAHEIRGDILCAGNVCVDEQQLAALLTTAGQTAAAPSTSAPAGALQAPVLELNGNASSTIQLGDTYNDLGARIVAPESDVNLGIVILLDGATTTQVSLDTSKPGVHTIEYRATNSAGTGSATRTVVVGASTEEAPPPPAGE
ncbi:DUF5011 domain-containing protein [Candidatus Kaiserbacteria bacterium]|nr:DUF5011 domain-containing protein [Candidatus Kaiserbacteria bacterium]